MNFIRRHLFSYLTIVVAVSVAVVFCANLYTSAASVSSS